MARPSKLPASPPQLVLAALRKARKPQTAYALLKKLAPLGVKGPPTVYRALAALMESGEAHRIESLNAYVACDCAPGHRHEMSVLAVCRDCHKVSELHSHKVIDYLTGLRQLHVNLARGAVIELPVRCARCA